MMSGDRETSIFDQRGPLAECIPHIEGLEDLSERRRETAAAAMLDILEVRDVLAMYVGASALPLLKLILSRVSTCRESL